MNNNFNFAKELKEKINGKSQVNVLCEKFSMRAFHFLNNEINSSKGLKILLHNNANDKSSNEYLDLLNLFDSSETTNDFLNPVLAKYVYLLIKNKKIEFKRLKTKLSGSSSFLITKSNDDEFYGFINFGSLTKQTLGLINNFDFFMLTNSVNDQNYLKDTLSIFQKYWFSSQTEDINEKLMKSLEYVFNDWSCYDIYHFSIFNIFQNNIDQIDALKEKESNAFKNTLIYKKLYDFQKNAVYGMIDKIEKFNGCILADSVGLGKTFEALAVIKFYELKRQKVLVLVPKKLKDNWTLFTSNSNLNPFINERFNYDIKTHTDINRTKGFSGNDDLKNFVWHDYDLVVIDESHNFRNFKWTDDDNATKSRYQLVMEKIIKSGRNTKVLLLTATPVNNRMQDINNQIKFITNNNDNALLEYGIDSISDVCRQAEFNSTKWTKLPENLKTSQTFDEMIGNKFKKLLNLLSIARSRKQIKDNYSNNTITFPERLAPKNIIWKLSNQNTSINVKEINDKLNDIFLAVYKPLNYVYEEYRNQYTQLDYNENNKKLTHFYREKGLVSLMKMNLFKRLESSIESFNETMISILKHTKKTIEIIKQNINKDLEFENNFSRNEIDDDDIEEFEEEFNFLGSQNLKIKINHIDINKFLSDLEYDVKIFEYICDKCNSLGFDNDEKLKMLIDEIVEKQNNPFNEDNKKMIIFTSFADTAKYLYDYLINHEKTKELNFGLVTGNINKSNHYNLLKNKINTDDLLTYFSPISKNIEASGLNKDIKIDILIATDCISEGQNLQDCDCLLNYDIHWNPVRIIQRFGRIDRLESKNKYIKLINFWPEIELDEYIKLESRIKSKMEKVVHASTGDDHLLKVSDSNFDNYRLKQLQQLKEQVVDMDDMKNEISISGLTLNEYLIDLGRYFETNKDKLSFITKGVYAIVGVEKNLYTKEGIIFLLKKTIKNNPKNFIDPYYLIYSDMNGNIIFSYKEINKILNIYKNMASLNVTVDKNSINKFNIETNYGTNMSKFKDVLNKVLSKIENENASDDFSKMFQKNAFIDNEKYDFEVLSLLIIYGNN